VDGWESINVLVFCIKYFILTNIMRQRTISRKPLVLYMLFAALLTLSISASMFTNSARASTEAPIVISHVQLGGAAAGTIEQEFIIVYNNSDSDILVNNWCLEFASSTTYREIRCIAQPSAMVDVYLDARSYVLFVNAAYASAFPLVTPDFVYSNNSNIPGTNGSIRLVNQAKVVVDTVGWGTGIAEASALSSLSGGNVFQRKSAGTVYDDTNNNVADFQVAGTMTVLNSGGLSEVEKIVDLCSNIDSVQASIPDGYLQDEVGDCYLDVCPNIAELQKVLPDGMYMNSSGACVLIPLENRTLLITELYPNAPGSDTGQEFVELYNPNGEAVSLKGYRLQVGPSFTDEYEFLEGEIGALSYVAFSDATTGIVLPNTTGVQLRIVTPAGTIVTETSAYTNAPEGNSWGVYEDQWIFSNQRTPNAANKPYLQAVVDEEVSVTTVLAPCPIGKYRNPETNRCRTIETAVSSLQPCDEDEYRNPETNRCRKLVTATSVTLVPCKTGQVRNPETNRCRNVSVASAALEPCPEGQERNPDTNRCRKVAVLGSQTNITSSVSDVPTATNEAFNWPVLLVALAGTGAYMVYEWRAELRQYLARFRR
jgi:hypothetical protein